MWYQQIGSSDPYLGSPETPMFNKTHHQETYRSTPNRVTPVSPVRIRELLEIERAKFSQQAPESGVENRRASEVTPLGVLS